MSKYTGWGVKINGTVASGIVEDSVKVSPNIQSAVQRAAGHYLPSAAHVLGAAPVIEFAVYDLDLITAPTLISDGFSLHVREYANNGLPGTGYISISASAGLIVPVSVSGSKGAKAQASLQVYCLSSDGTTSPVTVGTATNTLGVSRDAYTLGDVSLGSDIEGVSSINLAYGYSVETNQGDNGLPYPTEAWIKQQETQLTIETSELSAASQTRLNTGSLETSALSASFRKLTEGGIPSGSWTATLSRAIVTASQFSASSPGSVSLLATPTIKTTDTDYLQFSTA